MEKQAASTSAGVRIPVDLLKHFKNEVRFLPANIPVAGYIIFDKEMLQSILLNNDAAARKEFARQLAAAPAELVLVAKPEAQQIG